MKADVLPIIQSLWIGSELSKLEQVAVSSFLHNGHAFHLYVYEEVRNVPIGVVMKDANDILDKSLIFKYLDRDTYAGFANLFRYKLLYDKGGFWVDMDVVCLRPFNFRTAYVFSTEGNRAIGNCVIKAPRGSSLMRYCYEKIIDRGDMKLTRWGETGPLFLRGIVRDFSLEKYAVDTDVFCPVAYEDTVSLVTKSALDLLLPVLHKVHGVHFWNEIWRLSKMDKNASYPDECFFEELKEKLLKV